MPKIEITHTERLWPGKYDDDGNLGHHRSGPPSPLDNAGPNG